MMLADGTCIPSYMSVRDTSESRGAPGFFDEVSILVGEVVSISYPHDPSNVTGSTEYAVNVWRRQSDGPQERIAFRCSQADAFGSVADWFRFSFRPSTASTDKVPLANGATVLVACLNGDRSNAYIIGAIPQPNRGQVDPDRGQSDRYMRSRFNGVELSIQDDGSFELKVPGATDADGKPDDRDDNNKGSKLSFAANGDITIDDQNGDSVKVSPGSKTIEVKAGAQTSEIDKKWELKASTVLVTANQVTIKSPVVNIGGSIEEINPIDFAVIGSGIDTLSGLPYTALGNTSKITRIKK